MNLANQAIIKEEFVQTMVAGTITLVHSSRSSPSIPGPAGLRFGRKEPVVQP